MFDSPVLPFIALFAMVFGIVYISVTARHRQRMAMIEKGIAPGDLSAPRPFVRNLTLKFGLLAVGIGLGVLIGYSLSWVMPPHPSPYNEDPENPVPYFFSILFCGGAALITEHIISKKGKA